MSQITTHSLGPLLLFSVLLTAILVTYIGLGIAPSPAFDLVTAFSWSLLVALWIVSDARRRKGIPCFDFGFFCYVFLPVAVPWYCFWSRGLRGLLVLACIVVLGIVPYLVAGAVWSYLYG